jgi:hypothetical protein
MGEILDTLKECLKGGRRFVPHQLKDQFDPMEPLKHMVPREKTVTMLHLLHAPYKESLV